MGHDIKRIADDEWESSNPIDFRGRQTKNDYAQRAWSDWNDDNYLALGLDAMRETGDKSGQYARYNSGTDSRKALDIAHLNLDDYYGSHITGGGLPNSGSAYSYNADALKVLPKDIGKLSTNEQGDIAPPPGGLRPKDYKAQRRSMGLPDIIPTITQPTVEPHEVEQEDEEPPELDQVGDPHAKPKDSEADVQAKRLEKASKVAHKGVVGVSASAVGDAGGTVQFEKEGETKKDPFFTSREKRLEKLETKSGRTVETLSTVKPIEKSDSASVKKGTSASDKLRATEMSEKKKDDEVDSESDGETPNTIGEVLLKIAKLNDYEYNEPDEPEENGLPEFVNDFQSDYVDAIVDYLTSKGQTPTQIANNMTREDPGYSMYDEYIAEHADIKKAIAWFKERGDEPPEELQARIDGKEPTAKSEATSRAGGDKGGFKAGHKFETRKAELEKAFPGITNGRKNAKDVSYGTLSTGQKKFLVAIAQGKPGKPSEDLLENYSIDQGAATERQHDYMMKMIDAHDKTMGKKGLTGWDVKLSDIAREIPSLNLGKLFSLSPEGRDIVYQSTRSMGEAAFKPKLRSLTDHDLDVLLVLYKRVKLSGGTRGEKYTASMVAKNAESETDTTAQRVKRLGKKGYE
jgi:hypothetical protein